MGDHPPKFYVAADVVAVSSASGQTVDVLLIERGGDPCAGRWACPGGFVEEREDLPDAAMRELREETGLRAPGLVQIGAWGRPGRDPRGRVVSVSYLAVVGPHERDVLGGDDARRACWHPLDALPALAFDHDEIVGAAVRTLRRMCERTQSALALLPGRFSRSELAVRLGALGALQPARAAVELLAAAPDVQTAPDGRYHTTSRFDWRTRLEHKVPIFPDDLT